MKWTCSGVNAASYLDVHAFTAYIQRLQETQRPILRIPKAARPVFAKGLTRLIWDVLQESTAMSWQRLLAFPLITLSSNKPGQTESLTTSLKRKIEDYLSNKGLPLLLPREELLRTSHKAQQQDTLLKRTVNAKLAEYNIRGAIQVLSSSSSVSMPDADSLAIMRSKHPAAPEDQAFPPPPSRQVYSFGPLDIQEALKSFPNGSGGGPDGLRPQHLKDATSLSAGDAAGELLQSLAALINQIGHEGVHETVRPTFFGARLIGLTKPNGDLRPIAVGNTLRRLMCKTLLHPVIPQISEHLQPVQVGVGTKLGCEAAVHAVRDFITSKQGDGESHSQNGFGKCL